MEWHQYQTDAATVFARLGCNVAVDAKLTGARAEHRIDVKVEVSKWGVSHLWIVECKHQKRRVTKAAVEALKSIVQDVGADKGFLLSEVGFQPAANAAAALTNVSLLSLRELVAASSHDLAQYRLALLEVEALSLLKLLRNLQTVVSEDRIFTTYRSKPGVDLHALAGEGSLVFLISALQGAKIGEFTYWLPRVFPQTNKQNVKLVDLQTALIEGSRLVAEVSHWYSKQEERMERASRRLARISGT